MATPRHLGNAPIEEAVLEFRVHLPEGTGMAQLRHLADGLSNFSVQSELRAMEIKLSQSPGKTATEQSQREHGLLLRSRDGGAIVRLAVESFAFSRLRPYTDWHQVLSTAFPLWLQYADALKPEEVSRLGVRFINKLDVPAAPFDQYLALAPAVPAPVPNEISEFLTRFVINDTARSCRAVTTQASGPAPPPDRMVLLLDIDAFREGNWAADEISEEMFTPLHDLKNEIFFASLTESAVTRYE